MNCPANTSADPCGGYNPAEFSWHGIVGFAAMLGIFAFTVWAQGWPGWRKNGGPGLRWLFGLPPKRVPKHGRRR